jgi:hypothetical protein
LAGVFIPIILKISIMLDAFRDFLDQIYYEGYAIEFEEENPTVFYQQLEKFKANHTLKK